MKFMHTKCGGEVDVKSRTCLRCKHKWNPIWLRLDPVGIRAIPGIPKKWRTEPSKKTAAPAWAEQVPLLTGFVDRLPKWPRWARILVTVLILVGIAALIILLRR